MNRLIAIWILIVVLATGVSAGRCMAQPKSFGAIFSAAGVELSYQHSLEEKDFFEVSAGIDYSELIGGTTRVPGGKLKLTYNIMFFDREFDSGKLSVYAGPGLSLGMVSENAIFGPSLGICGRLGLEYRFLRPVTFSVDFCPLFGMHMKNSDRNVSLDFFRKGMIYSLYPIIGIRYNF